MKEAANRGSLRFSAALEFAIEAARHPNNKVTRQLSKSPGFAGDGAGAPCPKGILF
jgi:hypothetical protein